MTFPERTCPAHEEGGDEALQVRDLRVRHTGVEQHLVDLSIR